MIAYVPLMLLYTVLLFGIPAITGCSLSTFCFGASLGIGYMLFRDMISTSLNAK